MSDQAVQIVQATPGPVCPLAARQHTVLLCAVPTPGICTVYATDAAGRQLVFANHGQRPLSQTSALSLGRQGRVGGSGREEERGSACGKPEKSCRTYGWHSQQLWEAMGQTCLGLSGKQGSGGPGALGHQTSQDAVGRTLWVGAAQNPHPRLCHA